MVAGKNLASVIGFGSYQNPRKNTFSNIRNKDSECEYIEINDDWTPTYYITYESSRDFFDECMSELESMRRIGPPPQGLKIILDNKSARSKEDHIYRRVDAQVAMSVAWDYWTPQIGEYVDKLKQIFPEWKWWENQD